MSDKVLSALVRRLQAVCVFCGDIVPTDEPPYAGLGWRSGRQNEADKTGPTFSYERMLAAAALYRMNPSLILVPSGGNTNLEGKTSPPIATVVAFELKREGVPHTAIIEEPTAFTSADQVFRCADIVEEREWAPERVAILAPCWQFGRISVMLNTGPLLSGVTRLISMERALAAEDSVWNVRFSEWYAAPEAREMFAKEALGTGQLLAGHQPKYPNPFRGFADPLV